MVTIWDTSRSDGDTAIFLFTDLWSSISLISETGSLKDTVSGDGAGTTDLYFLLSIRQLTGGQYVLPVVLREAEDLRDDLAPGLGAGQVGVRRVSTIDM